MGRKAWKPSTMPTKDKPEGFVATEKQKRIFKALKELLAEYKKGLDIRVDTEDQFELWTFHKYRTVSFRPQSKQGILFAGVAIRSSHVGLYFYPLHINEDFVKSLPDELRACLKGHSAIHIKSLSDAMLLQLRQLIEDGLAFYKREGYINN